jgi:hypothetical protein
MSSSLKCVMKHAFSKRPIERLDAHGKDVGDYKLVVVIFICVTEAVSLSEGV